MLISCTKVFQVPQLQIFKSLRDSLCDLCYRQPWFSKWYEYIKIIFLIDYGWMGGNAVEILKLNKFFRIDFFVLHQISK